MKHIPVHVAINTSLNLLLFASLFSQTCANTIYTEGAYTSRRPIATKETIY